MLPQDQETSRLRSPSRPPGIAIVAGVTLTLLVSSPLLLRADGPEDTRRANAPVVFPSSPPDGSLDPSFGTGGKVSETGTCPIVDIALRSDGKIIAAGFDGPIFAQTVSLTRYNFDGSLDSSFGTGGRVTSDLTPSPDEARALALQADGKIVVAGFNFLGEMIVARYDPDGSLDPAFGIGGVVSPLDGEADDVLIQPDGKILAAGFVRNSAGADFVLVRLHPNGLLDAGFGAGGIVTTDFGGFDAVSAIALQVDGKIVAVGFRSPSSTEADWALARYLTNGSLDPSFGSFGKLTTDFGSFDTASDLAILANGDLVVAGSTFFGGGDFALARYRPNGSLDSGFGTGGKVTTDFSGGEDLAGAVRSTFRGIVVAGGSRKGAAESVFALARYLSDGSLDARFGTAGKVETAFDSSAGASALAVYGDGRLVAGGCNEMARYRVAPPLILEIPTLDLWGLLALAVALGGLSVMTLKPCG